MPRKKSPDFSKELRRAIEEARLSRPDAAALLGVKPNTLDKWLAPSLATPAPRWALDLLQLKVERIRGH
jgi:hypothetical protein